MAHENEYLGAVAGMHETYGSPQPTLAIGDFISGLTAGRRWSGRIEWIDGDRITIDVGGGWVAVSASDVTFWTQEPGGTGKPRTGSCC